VVVRKRDAKGSARRVIVRRKGSAAATEIVPPARRATASADLTQSAAPKGSVVPTENRAAMASGAKAIASLTGRARRRVSGRVMENVRRPALATANVARVNVVPTETGSPTESASPMENGSPKGSGKKAERHVHRFVSVSDGSIEGTVAGV
jgi:hypothetical protein